MKYLNKELPNGKKFNAQENVSNIIENYGEPGPVSHRRS